MVVRSGWTLRKLRDVEAVDDRFANRAEFEDAPDLVAQQLRIVEQPLLERLLGVVGVDAAQHAQDVIVGLRLGTEAGADQAADELPIGQLIPVELFVHPFGEPIGLAVAQDMEQILAGIRHPVGRRVPDANALGLRPRGDREQGEIEARQAVPRCESGNDNRRDVRLLTPVLAALEAMLRSGRAQRLAAEGTRPRRRHQRVIAADGLSPGLGSGKARPLLAKAHDHL